MAARLAREYPETNAEVTFAFAPVYERLVGGVRTALLVLMGVVAVVLLIACANLANLLLARAKSREREMAVRAALGAGRTRLLRQHLTESVVLALAGSALGLLVAGGILDVLPVLAPFEIPRFASVRIDPLALLFTTAVALATGLLFGLAPAWQATRADLRRVACTTACAAPRVAAAGACAPRSPPRRWRSPWCSSSGPGLLVQSLVRLLRVDAGFVAENLLTFNVAFVKDVARPPEQRAALAREMMARLAVLPGVIAAGAGTRPPAGDPAARHRLRGRRGGDDAGRIARVLRGGHPRLLQGAGHADGRGPAVRRRRRRGSARGRDPRAEPGPPSLRLGARGRDGGSGS